MYRKTITLKRLINEKFSDVEMIRVIDDNKLTDYKVDDIKGVGLFYNNANNYHLHITRLHGIKFLEVYEDIK